VSKEREPKNSVVKCDDLIKPEAIFLAG
jgi:hypothetical protein